jgi:hypothetical protein
MAKTVEEQMVSDAIAGTEKEIFAEATGAPEADTDVGEQGDRGVETMGEGLEGQQDDADADDAEAEANADAGAELGEDGKPKRDADGKFKANDKDSKAEQPTADDPANKGRVPAGRLREEAAARKVAEDALAAEKADKEGLKGEVGALNKRLDDLMAAVASGKLAAQPPQQQKPATEADDPRPDMFADPESYEAWQDRRLARAVGQVQQNHEISRVETSMQLAHDKFGDGFQEAYGAVTKLDPRNPRDVQTVREIWASPNPGRSLMNWHNQRKTLAEVGDDPAKYREKVANETREALMKDPDFRKQLLEDIRAEASGNGNGKPRTVTRSGTPSLNGARGGSMGQLTDRRPQDGSDAAVFESAFDN